jgi:hypothetical protein
MKKFVREWVEGKGDMQTGIRKLTNWAYPTEEQTKLQLLKVIEKKPGAYGPHTLQYAIDRRKREIQWDFLYLPFLALSTPDILLLVGALFSQNHRLIYLTLAVITSLVFVFRSLCSLQYLEFYRITCAAADAIWKERFGNPVLATVSVLPPSESKKQAEQLDFPPMEKSDPEVDEDALPQPGKGAIPLFLLHELIKREAHRPNICSGDIHETVLLHADLSGRRPKNILSRLKNYKSRRSIILATENSRTTHRQYLEKLRQHYLAIGDVELAKGAEDLLLFIQNNSGAKP